MINYQKLIETAEHHIRRGDGMVMDPGVIKSLAIVSQAALDTLNENMHLADGENCTLKTLRDAYLMIDPAWSEVGEE